MARLGSVISFRWHVDWPLGKQRLVESRDSIRRQCIERFLFATSPKPVSRTKLLPIHSIRLANNKQMYFILVSVAVCQTTIASSDCATIGAALRAMATGTTTLFSDSVRECQ
jgi:hypothetical protein